MTFDKETEENIQNWLEEDYDAKTKRAIQILLKNNPKELENAFYTRLSFGTGGLRGLTGIGTNRINEYTIASATQGLANYLLYKKKNSNPAVFIAYDSRHSSSFFAEVAARVLSANGIFVYIYRHLRPVPLASFGCRFKKCAAAIMITASHNPPQYNGYKVYASEGMQVLPPEDRAILEEIEKIRSLRQIHSRRDLPNEFVTFIDEEIDEAYLVETEKKQTFLKENREQGHLLKIIYTPLHGTGITLIPDLLKRWGFTSLSLVREQSVPDGNFPTVQSPNPEEEEALALGKKQLLREEADLLLATDPDADRIGVMIRSECKAVLLTGNEIACLLTDYLCKNNTFPNGAVIKTIVTSELMKKIAESYGISCFNVLTGFKYIGELITEWEKKGEKYHFIFAGEESYGYLVGTHVREKDAVIMSGILSEMALQEKLQNRSLLDALRDLYEKHGFYKERLLSLTFPDTRENQENIRHVMKTLRKSPPASLAGISIAISEDYENAEKTDWKTGWKTPLDLPRSNVLLFWLEDESKVVIRPSGTEPKLKIYCGIVDRIEKDPVKRLQKAENKIDRLIEDLKSFVNLCSTWNG